MFSKKIVMVLVTLLGLGFMSLSLNASDMKCGAGKCGSSMSKDKKTKGCTCKVCDHDSCAAKKDPTKACDCDHSKVEMKCGAGKCGKSTKCGGKK